MKQYELLTPECIEWVKKRYYQRYDTTFEVSLEGYKCLAPFKISDNIFETGQIIKEEAHYIMRLVSQYYMEKVFDAMLIDMTDSNVAGEKGTPYRFVKMYCGDNLEDDSELLSGRWAKKPRLATFPNEHKQKFPITKRCDIVAVCSHHTAPFSTMFRSDSYALVSYIPKDKVLGISKLQRIVDWVSRRGHLQEDLTMKIFEEVSKAAETDDVYVCLYNLVHTCEKIRGAQSQDGCFTSEYYGGEYNNPELRESVRK